MHLISDLFALCHSCLSYDTVDFGNVTTVQCTVLSNIRVLRVGNFADIAVMKTWAHSAQTLFFHSVIIPIPNNIGS